MRNIKWPVLMVALSLSIATVASGAPVSTTLTADTMDYDTAKGFATARGKVVLTREGITVRAERGESYVDKQTARLWPNVTGSGIYEGQDLDFRCAELSGDFSGADMILKMSGGMVMTYDVRYLEADWARMEGQFFEASKVTRFEDKERQVTMKSQSMKGRYDDKGLADFEAQGSVYATQRNVKKELTELWGDKMTYQRDRDRFVVTGHARAAQVGRRLTAAMLYYYPSTGKLEATGRPRITIDMNNGGEKK